MRAKFVIKLILFCIAIVSIVVSVIGNFGDFTNSEESVKCERTSSKLPLSDLKGIVVNGQGQIYCGLTFFSRVQVYNKQGKFLYGLRIKCYGGDFHLGLDENDNLMVSTIRGQETFIFDKKGRQIQDYKSHVDLDEDPNQYKFQDARGCEYRIITPLWNPRIIKVQGDKEETIINQTLIDRLLTSPFPSFFLGIIGLLLICCLFNIFSTIYEFSRWPKLLKYIGVPRRKEKSRYKKRLGRI